MTELQVKPHSPAPDRASSHGAQVAARGRRGKSFVQGKLESLPDLQRRRDLTLEDVGKGILGREDQRSEGEEVRVCGGIWMPSGPSWRREYKSSWRSQEQSPYCVYTVRQARAKHFQGVFSAPSTTSGWSNNYFFTSQLKNGCPTGEVKWPGPGRGLSAVGARKPAQASEEGADGSQH